MIRQQNEARKGQQSDEQRFQKFVHPENFNDQSTPVGENTGKLFVLFNIKQSQMYCRFILLAI